MFNYASVCELFNCILPSSGGKPKVIEKTKRLF